MTTRLRSLGLSVVFVLGSRTPPWARGMFIIGARLAPEKLDAAIAAILGQIDRVRNEMLHRVGFSDVLKPRVNG